MLVSQIDYNLIADIIRLKETVQQSVEGVMEDRLTASHLASDVYMLLESLDKLEVVWRGTPPTEEAPPAEQSQPEQSPPEGQQQGDEAE